MSPLLAGLLIALRAAAAAPAPPRPVVEVSFDAHPDGPYTDAFVRADWPDVRWVGLAGRATLVSEKGWAGGRCLQIVYPKGSVGPGEGGGQFLVRLPPRAEYCLDYYLMFREGFDFRLGGKLPGLCGGRCNTGGDKPTGDGWSARYMWKKAGGLILYLYHLDQPTRYGEGLNCEGVTFNPGQWYRVTQLVRVNAPGARDGRVQVWVDRKPVLERSDIRYRSVEGALADHFYFSTFHGGNSPDWGPTADSVACFDHFRIYEQVEGVLAQDLRAARRPVAASAATVPRAEPKPRRVPRPGAVEVWDSRLQARVREAVAGARRIDFHFSGVGRVSRVRALGEDGGLQLQAGGSAFAFAWTALSMTDRARLAAALAEEGTDADRAVAAFFGLASGSAADAEPLLRRLPEAEARAVQEGFE